MIFYLHKKVFLKNNIKYGLIIRDIFKKNSKIEFKKKFILNCFYVNKKSFCITSVCNISGKFNSSISKISFKRHTFKTLLTLNLLPNFYKKYK